MAGGLLLGGGEHPVQGRRGLPPPLRQGDVEGAAVARPLAAGDQPGGLHPGQNAPHRGRLDLTVGRDGLLIPLAEAVQVVQHLGLAGGQAQLPHPGHDLPVQGGVGLHQ